MNQSEFYLMMLDAMVLIVDEMVPAKNKGRDKWVKRANNAINSFKGQQLLRQFDKGE